jgi:hypothetical protein
LKDGYWNAQSSGRGIIARNFSILLFMPSFNIFISYRRKGGFDTAKLIYDRLSRDGYSVSFDMATLENGNFDNELEKRIKKCKDFIVILSPKIFDFSSKSYDPEDDWVRTEIECALKSGKNIVPLLVDGFAYPNDLPEDIKDISRKNSIKLDREYFDAAYDKMKEFLLSKPHWKVRHEKKVRNFFVVVIFVFIAFLFFKLYADSRFKIKEAEMRAQRADSIRISREAEITLKENSIDIIKNSELLFIVDSINKAKEKEIARMIDSMNNVQRARVAFAIDSVRRYMNANKQSQPQAQAAKKTTAPKSAAQKSTTQKSSKTR